MASMATTEADRTSQLKAFDGMKNGVKGLVDSGITEIPAMFRVSPDSLTNLKPPPSSSQLKIPTIDLRGRELDTNHRRSVVDEIGEAAEKLGFFQVINHGIPMDVLQRMIEGTRAFHELEPEAKKRFYSRDHQNRNLVYYSNFALYSTVAANWRDTLTCYTAPDPPRLEDLPEVCGEILMEHSKQMMNLGEFLFELLSEALGLNPNHLKEIGCAKSQMSTYLYYPPCPQPDLALGINKHTDVAFLTILLQDNIGGLQILHDQYLIDVLPIPGALIVNIGDLLQLITNDKFISPVHRVIANRSSEPRISVPCFFTSFRKENPTVFGPIKELLSEHNPPKYRDLTITEFVKVYSSKEISIPTLPLFRI